MLTVVLYLLYTKNIVSYFPFYKLEEHNRKANQFLFFQV